MSKFMKVEVYITSIDHNGKQYVGVVDGNIRRLHFSTSDSFAKEDIVPTMIKDFGVEPVLYFDSVNTDIRQQLEELYPQYEKFLKHNEHLTMNDWLDTLIIPKKKKLIKGTI